MAVVDTDIATTEIADHDEKDYAEVIEEALARFKDVQERDKDNRDNAKSDTKFVYLPGEQWPEKWKNDRELADDPCLEFPQLKQFVNQVINEQRQSRPGIRVHPANGKADDKKAEILQGMVRHIEYDSNAEAAYDGGFQHAVVGGRGYWRIASAFESGRSFNQKLLIKRIPDPDTVYPDLDFQEPDGSDSNFCFVTESVKHEDFEKRWPNAEPMDWDASGKHSNWYESGDVVVADYYRRVCTKRQLVQMSDGAVGWKDELPPTLPPGVMIVQEREADDYTVEWYKIAGGEQVLEEFECPGSLIPVVMCMGDEIMIDGDRIFQGLIRQARDAQVMYNFEQSQKIAMLSMAPRNPWIVAEESIEDYKDQWKNANKKNYSSLVYRTRDDDGNPIPPPQRSQFAPVPTGWAEAAQQSKDDIKSVIGMYQNSLGQHSGETSGRAILAREKQGDNATFHFADNLARAIALTGKILVGMIPTYYDTQRMVTCVGVDDARSTATINEQVPDQRDPSQMMVNNDMTCGDYSIVVEAGPSYATKQETTREALMSLVQSFPPMMQFAGDLIVGNLDFPDADKLAERLRVMLPPQIQAEIAKEENPNGPPPLPPEVQAQMQQMQQQLQQAGQAVQQLQGELQQAQAGTQADMAKAQAQAQLARDKSSADLQLEREKADAAHTLAIDKARMDAEVKIEVARIGAETDLTLAGMQTPPELHAGETEVAQQGPKMEDILQCLAAAMQQASGPRHHQIQMDESGNVTGLISSPAPQTVQ